MHPASDPAWFSLASDMTLALWPSTPALHDFPNAPGAVSPQPFAHACPALGTSSPPSLAPLGPLPLFGSARGMLTSFPQLVLVPCPLAAHWAGPRTVVYFPVCVPRLAVPLGKDCLISEFTFAFSTPSQAYAIISISLSDGDQILTGRRKSVLKAR